MANRVEKQVAAARGARFRFMSPGKLFGKLKESTEGSVMLSSDKNLRSLHFFPDQSNNATFYNP